MLQKKRLHKFLWSQITEYVPPAESLPEGNYSHIIRKGNFQHYLALRWSVLMCQLWPFITCFPQVSSAAKCSPWPPSILGLSVAGGWRRRKGSQICRRQTDLRLTYEIIFLNKKNIMYILWSRYLKLLLELLT